MDIVRRRLLLVNLKGLSLQCWFPRPRPRAGTPWTMSDKIVSVIRHDILSTMKAQEPWLSPNLSNLQNVSPSGFSTHRATCRGGDGGGGYSTKSFYGESSPRVLTPYPFIYHFWQKRHPIRIPSVELCIPFCKCSLFQIRINLNLEHFLDFFTALNCIC